MTTSINLKFILIVLILAVFCDFSYQRPSDLITPQFTANGLAGLPPLPNLESLPAFQLLRNIIIRQNQVADAMLPIMIRALTNPVPGLAEALQRSMALFGVTSYLVGPTIARSARNLSPVMEPLVGSTEPLVERINQISEFEPLFEETLTLLGINNEQCKQALTCLAGKTVASDYPILASYLSQATATLPSNDDKYAKLLIQTMGARDSQCTASCPNLVTMGRYWQESKEKELVAVAQEAFADSLSKTLTSLLFDAATGTNDINAIANPAKLTT